MLLFSIMARGWRGENSRKTRFLRFYLYFRGRFIHSLAHLTLIVAAVMEQRGSLASCLDFKARTVFDVPGFPTFTCSGPSFYHPARGRGHCRRTPRSSHRIPEQEAAAHRWPSPARGVRWGLMQSCPALTQPPHRARAFGTGPSPCRMGASGVSSLCPTRGQHRPSLGDFTPGTAARAGCCPQQQQRVVGVGWGQLFPNEEPELGFIRVDWGGLNPLDASNA